MENTPRTDHFCKLVADASGNTSSWFKMVCRDRNLQKRDRLYYELKALCDRGGNDQLNLGGE